MIVIRIELHSHITKKISVLGQMIIANTGGSHKRGDYSVHVGNKKDVGNLGKIFHTPLRSGSVKDYPRLSYNVWRLVIRALLSAFPEERAGSKK